MYIKESTKLNYKTVSSQLQEFLKGKNPIEHFQSKDPKEINKTLDKFIDSLQCSEHTKATKLSSIRSVIQNELDILLPKSKLAPLLSKSKNRLSNKAVITHEEVRKLSEYFETEAKDPSKPEYLQYRAWRDLILFKLHPGTSQRVSDILSLTVEEASQKKIHFKQEKTGAEGFLENPCLTEILFFKTKFGLKNSDYLFASGKGFISISGHLSRKTAWDIIKKAAIRVLNRWDISSHTFRKYVTDRLSQLGYSAEEIKTITLHASIGMVEYYTSKRETVQGTKNLLLGE